MEHSAKFLALVNEAKSRTREITIEEVRRKQQAGEKFEFVDVREDNEWNAGRAAGSRHFGRGILERDAEKAFPDPKAMIVLYCGGGFRSALAADNMQKMGYKNVWSMAGGIRAWRDAKLPEEK